MNQIIWKNSDVKCNNNILMFHKWKDASILYLSDVVINNRFMNLTELRQNVQCPSSVFNLQKLLTAIRKAWKILISENKFDSNIPESNLMFRMGKNIKHIATLSTKQIYGLLVKMGYEPICIKYWQNKFDTLAQVVLNTGTKFSLLKSRTELKTNLDIFNATY